MGRSDEMKNLRVAIALAMGAVSCMAVVISCALRPFRVPDHQTAGGVQREPSESARAAVEQTIERARALLGRQGQSVVEPDALLRDVRESLLGLSSGDPERYLAFRSASGLVFNREGARQLAGIWYDRQIVDRLPGAELSDGEMLRYVWATADQRRMRIQALLPERTRAGRGTLISPDEPDEWPYAGAAQFCSCLFLPSSGPFQRSEGEQLDRSERSAHVTVGVRFAGDIVGHLRLNYFFDEATRSWVPVTIAVASSAEDFWPWPVF